MSVSVDSLATSFPVERRPPWKYFPPVDSKSSPPWQYFPRGRQYHPPFHSDSLLPPMIKQFLQIQPPLLTFLLIFLRLPISSGAITSHSNAVKLPIAFFLYYLIFLHCSIWSLPEIISEP